MEDRLSPYLYMELSGASPDAYAVERVDSVMALSGVERAIWWRNLHYQRKDFEPDFVFRVEDFRTLGVYEVAAGFKPPTLPSGLRALHFRHTPRPAQGFLTGEPTQGLMLVLISAREPSGAQDLRDWADFVHLPPLAVGDLGFSMITPYENVTGGSPLYMHFYETLRSDAESALQAEVNDFPARYGGTGTAAYRHWQVHENLIVDYINTFERVGARA